MRKALYLLCLAGLTIISGQEHCQAFLPGGATIKGNLVNLDGNIYGVYKNIPYAEEPLNERRFQPPVMKHLVGEVDGTRDSGPKCPHAPSAFSKNMSEDCLHLDIYSPQWAPGDPLLPVMVWIYGGGYITGSTQDYNPEGFLGNLVSRGVILVAINYRLGPLGFLVSWGISITGNMGILDQILALRWMQTNIQAFGGDSQKVTIFGESAGSMSCSRLMLSPLATGLFSQAILMSGSAWPSISDQYRDMDALSKTFIEMIGCNKAPDVLDCLQSADLSNVTNAADKMTTTEGALLLWWPIFNDGNVLPGSFEELSMNRLPIPTIVGTNKDELGIIDLVPLVGVTTMDFPHVDSAEGIRVEIDQSIKKGAFGLPAETVKQMLKEEYVDKFLAADPDNAKDGSHWLQQAIDMRSAHTFHVGAYKEAVALHSKGAPIFLYSFDYCNPEVAAYKAKPTLEWKGSVHALDLVYIFGLNDANEDPMLFDLSLVVPSPMTQADLKIRELFGVLWTNFAKTGNPSEVGEITWTKFGLEEGNYLSLNWPNLEMKTGFHREMIRFWEKLENRRKVESVTGREDL